MEEPKLVWDDTENAENHQNGEKADEKGPCKCGYRHWVDGGIYDFVFGLQGESIGFNLGDNALATAEEFMRKKNNMGLGFKTKEHVNFIANHIRQALVKEGFTESDTREEWDPSKPMKTIRLGETGRILPNGTKLTFEVSDILTADQRAAAQKREEDSRKLQEQKRVELENAKKIKEDINRAREQDHLEREKNREWHDSLRAMNDSPSLHSSAGEKIKKWMINGVLTDVTLEQYVKLKENSEKDFISPKDTPSANHNDSDDEDNEGMTSMQQKIKLIRNMQRVQERIEKEREMEDDKDDDMTKQLRMLQQMQNIRQLMEMQEQLSGSSMGNKKPKTGNNTNNNNNNKRKVMCPCGFENNVEAYLPTPNDTSVSVQGIAAMLNLKGKEACKKWLEGLGADEDKLKEAFEKGEKYLKTHLLPIIDPNDPWKGTGNSIAGSTSTSGSFDNGDFSSLSSKKHNNNNNNNKLMASSKKVELRWAPVENFKIVLKDGDKTKLKIVLIDKTQLVLQLNLSTTLRELHDHIRTESKVGMLTDFDLVKQDSPTNILDSFDKTLLELNLKNQLLMCLERNS
jgi:hypothetical protein